MIDLSRFPRITLAHLPTPLEFVPNLSRELGGPAIYVKRDDCTGLGGGGNKVRKLEFLLGEAMKSSVTRVLTFGALQSNHVRQTAAACARLGLACEAILIDQTGYRGAAYRSSGNLLLDELFGARIHRVENEDEARERAAMLIAEFGDAMYSIPAGGSNAVGALGYVNCAGELRDRFAEQGLDVQAIVHACSSGGTQAGLMCGLWGQIDVVGINVYDLDVDNMKKKVADLCRQVDELLDVEPKAGDVTLIDDYLGEGYGLPTEAMKEAVALVARLEGILLDPVYTGKAMAALIGLVRSGYFDTGRPVVFLHTGGSPGLFAYPEVFAGE